MSMHRDFKGIWIPKQIWLINGLKPQYRIFLAEIDSLDNGDGCYASNEHFSLMFGLSKSRCSEIVVMLENKGFVTVKHDNSPDGGIKRVIQVCKNFSKKNTPSENRIPPSENRIPPSENRIPPSENRIGIYKELEIQLEIHRERRALDFLFENYEQRFTEEFLMPYKKQIKNFKKFWADFNDVADDEKRNYDDGLFFRLGRFARNWIEVQNREKQKTNESPTSKRQRLA